jgi:hypothetical protein
MKVFIGWDSREDIAYQVCRHSILARTDSDVHIIPLKQDELREKGFYTRDVDPLSSTEFTFTRFLVPHLMEYNGWAVFCDCDFLFQENIEKLFKLTEGNDQYAVMVVKHDYSPENSTKMDGQTQYQYPRKNWSSLILWNCGHPSNKKITPKVVNATGGAFLHRFLWLKDEEIGTLSPEWNWLVGWYKEPKDGVPKALHYTEGGPWFDNYLKTEYGGNWIQEKYSCLGAKKEPPPPVSLYDNVPDEIKNVFDNIIKYRVDPSGIYYNITEDIITEQLKDITAVNLVSTDSEFRYSEKGHMYDPILQNFILGAGGQISTWGIAETGTQPVLLRGITKRKQMRGCREQGRDFYYIDTGYFGNGRKKSFHRVTKNNMQNVGPVIDRPGDRFDATGISLTKFRPGSKILLCPPSAKVMVFYDLDLEKWIEETIETIKKYTDREIVIRLKKGRSERVTTDTMAMALSQDVHCMVTFNSIAATESLLLGKPAFTLGPNAAQSLCLSDLSRIEKPYIPTLDEVHKWASHLAYCQFTESEMRSGLAWRIVSET